MFRKLGGCKTQNMAQTFTNVLSGGGMKKEGRHQEIVLVVIKFIMILKINLERENILKTLDLSKYFHSNVFPILAYQEKLGNEKEPCFDHASCKIGLHCGKSNCDKIVNYQTTSFDCCEECKKLRKF